MSQKKKSAAPTTKTRLHTRNKHRERYDFKALVQAYPELKPFVALNPYNDESIDFFNPEAVKALNKALLLHHYDIHFWDIPQGYLCPPIPGRADYIHYAADILCDSNFGKIPQGSKVRCLDIGVGANCIYPIIATHEYGWTVVGSDIDASAIVSAQSIVEQNQSLHNKVDLRLQPNPKDVFYGIIHAEERFDISVCNPPFHTSLAEAQAGTVRKLSNLTHKKVIKPVLNFGGQQNELWCEGGELGFILKMIKQSKHYANACYWFTTLVSKQANVKRIEEALTQVGVVRVKQIPMGQGNKTSRLIAWTFLTAEQQQQWAKERWRGVDMK